MKKKRSFLDNFIDTLSATAAAELSERMGDTLGMSERSKATARRHMRKQLRGSMRDGVNGATAAAKKIKEKVSSASKKPPIAQVQFDTACSVLGLGKRPYGKPVGEELIRESKRAAAKMFHPDVSGESKREQFQAVVQAAKWLEKYNEQLGKK